MITTVMVWLECGHPNTISTWPGAKNVQIGLTRYCGLCCSAQKITRLEGVK